jgi:hypothetical protein
VQFFSHFGFGLIFFCVRRGRGKGEGREVEPICVWEKEVEGRQGRSGRREADGKGRQKEAEGGRRRQKEAEGGRRRQKEAEGGGRRQKEAEEEIKKYLVEAQSGDNIDFKDNAISFGSVPTRRFKLKKNQHVQKISSVAKTRKKKTQQKI